MPSKHRPDPIIPDHEVLRKIGGGAYGEVWLARGVTGALRAIKIVWREDFDDARSFEREFEGILKFEPISRDHPGLVNILHVGRSPDGTSFYYYVMELGDDVATGADINAVEYEPRTLRADSKNAAGVRLETNLCIDVGLRLAEALDHLHERGLAHRDIKPANVIFVNGRPKLADIGLVAAGGQRTFVGTEGFVPPEGPGSAEADVYSLGKVLYEIATGKDRLDFPELPDESPPPEERKRWLELNRVICDVCDPYLSRRKIRTAAELAEALRGIQRGKRRRSSGRAAWITSFLLLGFVGVGSWEAVKNNPAVVEFLNPVQPEPILPPERPPAPKVGRILIVSFPDGADVMTGNQRLGVTPLSLSEPVGTEVEYTLLRDGYSSKKVRDKVPDSAVTETFILGGELMPFTPPQPGQNWENLGSTYLPVADGHLGSSFVSEANWIEFSRAVKLKEGSAKFLSASQNGKTGKVALVNTADAAAYCEWLRADAIKGGRLTEDHEMIPRFEDAFNDPADAPGSEQARGAGLKPFHILTRLIQYGRVTVSTVPPGAVVMLNEGRVFGDTTVPLTIERIKPGKFTLGLTLDGYVPMNVVAEMPPGGTLEIKRDLEEFKGVRFGKPWKNGLGMQFVPAGPEKELMVSIWETRVSDFDEFRNSNEYKQSLRKPGAGPVRPPSFPQGKDHPVVNVSRDHAAAFCVWLTAKDQADKRISVSHEYRLPTDLEWSLLAGLEDRPERTPDWRDAHAAQVFPWGTQWPPPDGCANLADVAAAGARGIQPDRVIPNYKDNFEKTSPVGSFPPAYVRSGDKSYEIFDLCGNAYEWVADDRLPPAPGRTLYGVLRGGSWSSFQPGNLYTGSRNAVPPAMSDEIYGFRVVLAKIPLKTETSENPEAGP